MALAHWQREVETGWFRTSDTKEELVRDSGVASCKFERWKFANITRAPGVPKPIRRTCTGTLIGERESVTVDTRGPLVIHVISKFTVPESPAGLLTRRVKFLLSTRNRRSLKMIK